jgi:hypothetical protein
MEKLLSATVLAGLLVSASAYAQSDMPVCNTQTGYDQYGRNDHPPGVMTLFPGYGQSALTAGVVPSTGLGEPNYGEAIMGRVLSPCDSGSARVWLLTGSNPSGQISVTVSYDLTVPPVQINTTCYAQPVWSEPWYAEGYPIPFWPPQTNVTDIQYDRDAHTATIFLQVSEYQWISSVGEWLVVPVNLAPWSNYSLNVLCPGRDQG